MLDFGNSFELNAKNDPEVFATDSFFLNSEKFVFDSYLHEI